MIRHCQKHGATEHTVRRGGNGNGWRCQKCQYAACYKRRVGMKAKLVALFGGKCVKCGYSKSIRALSFHHRDPTTKLFGIGGQGYSWKRTVAEAQKCDLLCANCHAEIEEELFGRVA